MSRKLVLLVLLIVVLVGILGLALQSSLRQASSNDAIDFQKGMSYATYAFKNRPDQYESPESEESLESMRRVGIEWVALNVVWYQDNFTSAAIYRDYDEHSPTDESVVHAINKCHALNMSVMLKPKIDCKTGWSGYIEPSTDWFSNYMSFIAYFAEMAETCDVELFCVGCELMNTTHWTESWQGVISNVRAHYSGNITYASTTGMLKWIEWWDKVDYVGINAYFNLTANDFDPSIETLKLGWRQPIQEIEEWRTNTGISKPIIFTEIGYQAVDGTNIEPWNYTRMFDPKLELDLQEQAECYEAAFQTLCSKTWFKGMYWWYWQTDPNPTDPTKNATLALRDYTPQNKPAQGVLTHWYYVIPEFPSFIILPLFMIATLLAVIVYRRKHSNHCFTERTLENGGVQGK